MDEDWVLPDFGPESPTMRTINRGCAAAGYEPRVVFKVNDCDMTLAMVAACEGISALPRLILPRDHPGVTTRPFADGAPIRRIAAVRLPTRFLTPATERFIELLETAAREYEARA
jgi:DNA-binding transcriptional LysR family regulator